MNDRQAIDDGKKSSFQPFGALVGAAAIGLGGLAIAARRQRMSMSLLAARSALALMPNGFRDAARLRKQMDGRVYPVDAPLPARLRRTCDVRTWDHDGQQVVTLVPRRGASRWHLLYLHGGAYLYPLVRAHWSIVAAIVEATGASVTVPLYALAPEHDHRRATALADAVYEKIGQDDPAAKIAVGGDSAGGNFALGLALRRRDAGRSLPQQLLLFSPWLDLTMRDPAAQQMEDRDVMLAVDGLREAGKWWAGTLDPASPLFSPLRADLEGLPPIAIYQGDRDIFVVDARSFAARAKAADIACDYREYPGGFHVFMGATFTPEARDVFDRVSGLLPR